MNSSVPSPPGELCALPASPSPPSAGTNRWHPAWRCPAGGADYRGLRKAKAKGAKTQKGRKDRAREDRGEGSWVNKEGEEKEWKQIKIWTGGYKSDRKCPQCTRGRKRGKDERWLKQIMISCCVLNVNTLKNITPEWIMTTGMRGHWNMSSIGAAGDDLQTLKWMRLEKHYCMEGHSILHATVMLYDRYRKSKQRKKDEMKMKTSIRMTHDLLWLHDVHIHCQSFWTLYSVLSFST